MKKLSIPISTFDVSYNLLAYPRSKLKISRKKANCQLFIYNLLDHFGYKIPMFRSSEIWKDKKYTIKVGEPRPLDILLFNKTRNAYGAHLALYLGNDRIIHLSKKVGYPTVWNLNEFKKCARYKVLLGIKRCRN